MADLKPIDCNNEFYNPLSDKIEEYSVEILKAHLIEAYKTIQPFEGILNCEIIQFFNHNHWNLLPTDWRECLTGLRVDELADLMNSNSLLSPPMKIPSSLLTIREVIQKLFLPRDCHKYHRLAPIHSEEFQNLDSFRDIYMRETNRLPFYKNLISFDKKSPPLSLLKYKCKDKKLSEIVVMGDLCFKSSLIRKVDFIVDIGAGLGHLSRCLAYFYGINVVTIEKDEKMTEEALRLDQKFLKVLKSLGRKDPKYNFSPQAFIFRITKEISPDITAESFVDLLEQAQGSLEREHSKLGNFKFGLVGLHPCGNLAPTMLNLYKSCLSCVFINIASCCYNKMTTADDIREGTGFIGFPLSKLQTEVAGEEISMYMGKNQLGLALHAVESHQQRFRLPEGTESFKADFYRALVEKFIEDVAPEFRETRRKNVKTVGPGGVTNFREYISLSIPDITKTGADFKNKTQKIEDHLKDINEKLEFHRIMAFSAIRHMFAPLLETIVLLDRLLYLKEDSVHCHVTQRFEPHISPRVHVITAFKQ